MSRTDLAKMQAELKRNKLESEQVLNDLSRAQLKMAAKKKAMVC